MPLPEIANVHRNAISGALPAGRQWANIVHTRWTGAGTPTTVQRQAMIDALVDTWRVDQAGVSSRILVSSSTAFTLTQVRSTPLDGVTASIVAPYTLVGTDGADPLANGTAFVVTLRTALRGRAHRGRIYLGGMCESVNQAPGIPSSVYVNRMVGQWEATRIALLAISWSLVVASYIAPGSAQLVTGCTSDARWDEQRRRQRP